MMQQRYIFKISIWKFRNLNLRQPTEVASFGVNGNIKAYSGVAINIEAAYLTVFVS